MSSRFLIAIALTLWSAGTLLLPGKVSATTPLNSATVEAVRQIVEVNLKDQGFRRAKPKQDTLVPKDALKTGQASMAELRFNDRSLARIGERALFEFQPGTREIQLNRGTVLLLIQPKQGTTRVRTPNAAAGIRGSALFVRYIPANPETGLGPMTIVGALTNSDITVSNLDDSQKHVLKAGQLAVVHKNTIGLYTFDLNSFYATSPLAKGLDLDQPAGSKSNLDPTIADVREETLDALKTLPVGHTPNNSQQLAANPAWMLMSPPTAQAPQSTETAGNSSNPLPTPFGRAFSGIASMNTAAEMLGRLGEQVGRPGAEATGSLPPGGSTVVLTPPSPGSVVNTPTPILPTPTGSAAAPTPQDIPRPTPNQPPIPSPIAPQPPVQTPPINNPAPTPITPPPAAAPTVPTSPVTPPVGANPPVAPPAAGQPPIVTPPPVVTPPAAPPVVVNPPVTTPVEPPTVPAPVPRPTPVTPATPAIPNPGAGPATPAVPASPAVNANVTVSLPTVDLSPVQPTTPVTPTTP
ncbi:FecR domain-containing protein [Pantanalinema rosaneae CENA516]|uniref:FecR domain-containing protein n=1 Tax=Pantanalinema rosaneae TaxID=1620701 RepID=UPI003D6E309E